jgi:hypothetical protein
MKQKIQLSESQLRNLIKESTKKILKEWYHSHDVWARKWMYGVDNIPYELEESGVLNHEEAEKLYTDIVNIFENIMVQGRFSVWSYPETYYEEGSEGCELEEIDYSELWEAVEKLQWPDDIIKKIQEYMEKWKEEQFSIEPRLNTNDTDDWKTTEYEYELGESVKKTLKEGAQGKVRLTESQLKKVIKESIKKAIMNEISSDMIGRARDKFIQKYGNNFMNQLTPGEMDQSLEKDKFNRKLHPKDKKPLAWHQANFNRAYGERYLEEHPEIIEKAKQLADTIQPGDWEDLEMTDHYEHGYGSVCGGTVVVDDDGNEWEFSCWGDGHYEGGWLELDDIEGIGFTAPNGVSGEI